MNKHLQETIQPRLCSAVLRVFRLTQQVSWLLLVVAFTNQAVAQNLVSWELSGATGSEATINSTSSVVGIGTGVLSRGAGLNATAAGGSINANGWFNSAAPTTIEQAIANNEYYEFTVPITSGTATISAVRVVLRASNTGPNTVQLRSSADNYATSLGTAPVTATSVANTITFPSPLSGLTGTMTFRLYGYGSAVGATSTPGTGGTLRIGSSTPAAENDLNVIGSVSTGPALPSLSINDVSTPEGNSGTATAIFSVSLSSPAPDGGVTFDITTADGTAQAGSDYVANALTGQTIPAASSTYSFSVTVNGDVEFEPDETFSVNITNINGATAGDLTGQGTIQNDDVSTQPTLAITGTLSSFTTTIGTPSATQSYTLNGTALTNDVLVTAPAGFEVSLNGGPFAISQTITQSGGNVNATIGVRLTGAAQGNFSGNVTNESAGAATQNVAVSGTVTDPNAFATIALARSQPDNTPIASLPGSKIAGRVTVSNQFGNTAYIQDPTGGIAVFGASFIAGVQIGDSVQITGGTITLFNQQKQVGGTVTFTNLGNRGPLVPKSVTVSQLPNFEGQLVAVSDAVIRPNTTVASPNPVFVFTPDANSIIQDPTGSAQFRIDRDTDLPGKTNPASATTIVGIVGRFNASVQLQPRFTQDVTGTTPYTPGNGTVDPNQTFDVATWNIEWLGNTGNGPQNESQQLANAITVINNLNSDVVVLEEISSATALSGLLSGLPGYQGNCSPFVSNNPGHEIPPNPATPSTVPDAEQRICILYKSSVATLVSQRPLLEQAQPLPGYPADPSNFWASGRYPYLWAFDVNAGSGTKRINLIGVHAKANTAPLQTSYDRRKYDVQVFYDSLKAQFPNDLLVIAGDYNDDVDRTVANVPPITESTYKPFVDDVANFFIPTRTLSDNGFRTFLTADNVIDHIAVSNELAPAYLAGSAGVGTPYTFIPDYGNTTSDHIPVFARFDLARLAAPMTPLALTFTASPTSIQTTGITTLSATVTGGTTPYSFTFSGPGTISATNNTATVSGLTAGVQIFTVTVTDVATPTSQTVSGTVSVTVSEPTSTAPFAITGVTTVRCDTLAPNLRRVTFNPQYAGLTDQPVSFSVVNELPATTQTGSYTLNLYTDNPTLTLQAVQGGNQSSFIYNWLAACGSSTPANQTPTVVNPITNQTATVGQAFNFAIPTNIFADDADASLLTLSVAGLPASLSFSPATKTISGTPTGSGTSLITVTATDAGSLSASTSFVLTVNDPGNTTPFAIASVTTVNCQTITEGLRRLTFAPNYVGLTGQPVSFSVANELPATTQTGPYTLNLYTDNPVITLQAVQGGVQNSFTYNWLSVCGSTSASARTAAERQTPLMVNVLGNPTTDETVTVGIQGAAGQRLRLQMRDSRGQLMQEQVVEQAAVVEQRTVRLGHSAGVYLLQVSTPTKTKVVKVVRQ